MVFVDDDFGHVMNIIGAVLFPIPAIVFYFVMRSQYDLVFRNSYLISILSLRAAVILPIFSITYFAALLVPALFPGLRFLQALTEGFNFLKFCWNCKLFAIQVNSFTQVMQF